MRLLKCVNEIKVLQVCKGANNITTWFKADPQAQTDKLLSVGATK